MGTLYLVRHGQASFGAENYDQLSELGQRQCRALGETLRKRGLQPAAVMRGTLHRHAQSWQALAEGWMAGGADGPASLADFKLTPQVWPGLDEYDSLALIQALGGEPLPPHDTPDGFKAHFRRLRQALVAWMEGRIEPLGMPAYAEFKRGVVEALDHVQREYTGRAVLVVSSGGPISTAVAHVLGAPPSTAVDLNMRLRNSALTELVFSHKRFELLAFNTLPHLERPAQRGWISYA